MRTGGYVIDFWGRGFDVYVSYGVPGRHVARFAMRNDRTMFLFVFDDRQGCHQIDPQDTDAHKQALKTEFGQTGWECPQILAALESCQDVYFDRVRQIRMDQWSRGRVGLLGDAAFCPSLLAGQGAALAMVAAYVLAGALGRLGDRPQEAFQRYDDRLRPFITGKQEAAVRFAGSFAPRTRFGLFFRNQITKAFRLPLVARLAMGSSLFDLFDLPEYPIPENSPS